MHKFPWVSARWQVFLYWIFVGCAILSLVLFTIPGLQEVAFLSILSTIIFLTLAILVILKRASTLENPFSLKK